MPEKAVTVGGIIGSTLIALLLTGSTRNAASPSQFKPPPDSPELARLKAASTKLYNEGHFLEARASYRATAVLAEREGNFRATVMNWNNAAICDTETMQFRSALEELSIARDKGERYRQSYALNFVLNASAQAYVQIGQFGKAILIVREALARPETVDPVTHAKLIYHSAVAMAELHRMDEATPIFLQCANELLDHGEVDAAMRALGALGTYSLRNDRLQIAEWALNEAFRIGKSHRIAISGNILQGLAQVSGNRGDNRSAVVLFDEAVAAPTRFTPKYKVVAERGAFRLRTGDLRGALTDFRQARQVAADMRADMIPVDEDRVALESGLSPMLEGLVDAGNRLAVQTSDRPLLEETFEAAEQNRLWSLRALLPAANDWRTKLTAHYWEVLARYQTLARASPPPSSEAGAKATALLQELQQMEVIAAGASGTANAESPLAHIRRVLENDTVLLSFHLSKTSSWLWAIDLHHVQAFPLCPLKQIESEVAGLRRALAEERPAESRQLGFALYNHLFAAVPETLLAHKHWRLELDGPLYELPFAALVTSDTARGPAYLIERADLESIPGALLAERASIPLTGSFVGIGDPVYSPADERYRGQRTKSGASLPRLPNTATELQSCARAWNSPASRILTGTEAGIESVRAALKDNPAILHFATHVVEQQGDHQSGVIALSLDSSGLMGLLGPKEIVARGVTVHLVVMDGCHSAQGESLPGAGLMGLTRAWIGAGAMSVMATQWDIPDDEAQHLMKDFYGALHAAPERGAASALREAQLMALRDPQARQLPGKWAGYFLLSRVL